MISPVTGATHTQPVAQPAVAHQAPSAAKPQASPADTVQISNAAKALVQQALETSAQTSREASGGDAQAIRLPAKQAAAKTHAK
jgi:hypothetical protein